jgi:hypothetical protein
LCFFREGKQKAPLAWYENPPAFVGLENVVFDKPLFFFGKFLKKFDQAIINPKKNSY